MEHHYDFFKRRRAIDLVLGICVLVSSVGVIYNLLGIGFHYENYNVGRNHKCKKSEFVMDEQLVPYWNSFIKDAERYGFDYNHIFCINKVVFGRSYDWQGITSFDNNTIHINEKLVKDTIGMRLVFYHELGHWYGLEHSKNIMAVSYNTRRDEEYTRENWEALVKDYFSRLKEVNN